MIYDPVTVGIRLKQCRKIRGFKQSEVAKRLGITAAYYSLLENGKKNISVAQLIEFADMHNLSVSTVLGDPKDISDATQDMSQVDLEIMEMLKGLDDKDKKQLIKHLQIMQYPELEIVDKPRKKEK